MMKLLVTTFIGKTIEGLTITANSLFWRVELSTGILIDDDDTDQLADKEMFKSIAPFKIRGTPWFIR